MFPCLSEVTREYHGIAMLSCPHQQGNECRTLLKRTDVLESLLPPEHNKFLVAFKSFNDVVAATFSYELHPDFERYISTFEQARNILSLLSNDFWDF